jgi:hypothetical protein
MLSDDTSTSAALGMCLLAFKRADIEDIRSERVDQRRIVDLGAWVSAISAVRPSTPILGAPRLATRAQSLCRQNGLGLRRRNPNPRLPRRSEARVQRDQGLRHLHGADNDEAYGRIEHVDQDLAVSPLPRHASIATKRGSMKMPIAPLRAKV